MEAIKIRGLSFKYKRGEEKVLQDLNLDIEKGQFVVIMGPTGAGKSTFANTLNGLIPTFVYGNCEGEISIFDKNPREHTVGEMAKDIGLVFQDFEAQLFSTTVELEMAFGMENFSVPREEMKKKIGEVLKTVKLEEFLHRSPASLSGGQKQRLAIGSVLATEPRILCMDEPTTDLDPIGKMEVFQIAQELRKTNQDLTLLIIEHETEEALHSERMILMEEGKIVLDGPSDTVLREVEVFNKLGIAPLQIAECFHKLGYSKEALPLTVDQAYKVCQEEGYTIDEAAYGELLAQDEEVDRCCQKEAIKVTDLHYAYESNLQREILKGIDLEIKEGEFIAVLGQNGSGKTTLIKQLNGLLKPLSGEVIVYDKSVAKSTVYDIGLDVGYVFQNPDHQIFSETVKDEVSFSPKMRKVSDEEIEVRVKEALAAVELSGYEEEDPFSVTKGERQRIAVASILSAKPKVIILDEPTTGLDYKQQRQMMEMIKKINKSGHTIIMVTHTMWVVAEYAAKVAVVKDGVISLYGKTRDVFKKDKELAEASLKVPQITALSNKLGHTCLSVNEFIKVAKKGGE